MRNLYEISGIVDRWLDSGLDRLLKDASGNEVVSLEDDILAVLSSVDDRLTKMDAEIANLKRYARKLRKNLNDILKSE
jgi:hypothetical protein